MLTPDEYIAFDCYFASLASMQVHPGAGTKEHRKLSLEECRDMALNMIELRRQLIAGQEN
jgi:hypothetical protein